MNIKPISFNSEMVRSLLSDRKTVKRRVVTPQPEGEPFPMPEGSCWHGYFGISGTQRVQKPPYRPGDILYVREAWCKTDCFGLQDAYAYKANDNSILKETGCVPKWRSPITMPREAARIFLQVTGVHVERLQDITCEQAEREGCNDYTSTALGFPFVWDSTIKPADRAIYGWDANPWVWVVEFERCKKPEEV